MLSIHVWISLSLLFWHKVLTSNFKRRGQRKNSQVQSSVCSLERWLIVPVSTGKTMRQNRMMCHTPPAWLVMPCSYPSTLLCFLFVPLYSIKKMNMVYFKELDTQPGVCVCTGDAATSYIKEEKAKEQKMWYFSFLGSDRPRSILAGCWSALLKQC